MKIKARALLCVTPSFAAVGIMAPGSTVSDQTGIRVGIPPAKHSVRVPSPSP